MSQSDIYFAAESTQNIGDEIIERVQRFNSHLVSSGKYALWSKLNSYYYSGYQTLGSTYRFGNQNEMMGCKVNFFRNNLEHIQNLITNQKPSFDPIATNTDVKSQAQTILAAGLLEYYLREKRLERNFTAACELATVFGAGFLLMEWDTTLGDVYDVLESGVEVKDGDVRIETIHPLDLIYDPSIQNFEQGQWNVVRQLTGKWDLLAQYPEFRNEILNGAVETAGPKIQDFRKGFQETTSSDVREDFVTLYKFFHKKCPALPEGRIVETLCDGSVIFDSALPYKRLPVFRCATKERQGAPDGYSVSFDMLPIQDSLDACVNTLVTAINTFGVSNIWSPRGAGLDVQSLSGALNLIETDAGMPKPEPLNLTYVPKEIFEALPFFQQSIDSISGINEVIKGNNPAGVNTSSGLALLASQAIQFSNGLQQSYYGLQEDSATFLIQLLQQFADSPRVANIVGKNNKPWLKEFKGSDIGDISRVTVDIGNPMAKTLSGRESQAQTMLQAGFVTSADQYVQVLTTGKLEPLYESKQRQLLLIRKENELLTEGVEPPVLLTDIHQTHILEHRTVGDDPDIRQNPEIMQALTMHIQAHINALETANPLLLQLLGQQSAAPQMPQAMDMGGQGGAIPPPGPPEDQIAEQAPEARMPTLPPGAPIEADAAYSQIATGPIQS